MPRDIEPESCNLPVDLWETMPPRERDRIALELNSRLRRRVWERIEEEHPDWPNWKKKIEFVRWFFGSEPLPRGFEEWMRERRDEKPPAF